MYFILVLFMNRIQKELLNTSVVEAQFLGAVELRVVESSSGARVSTPSHLTTCMRVVRI